MSLRLLSPSMAEEDEIYQRRMGFWLRMARERSGKSQAGAAEFLNLSPKSKSTISDYENGRTPVPIRTLRRLADWYGVPLEAFTRPEKMPEERLDELVRASAALVRQDLEVGQEEPRDTEDGHGGALDRRPA